MSITNCLRKLEPLEPRRLLAINLIADINQVSQGSRPTSLVAFDDAYYYRAATGPESDGLWRFDPTSKTSELVRDDLEISNEGLTVVNDAMYFRATVRSEDGASNREFWKSDGTPEGTRSIEKSTSFEKFLIQAETFDPSIWIQDWSLIDFAPVIEQLSLDSTSVDGPYNLAGKIIFALNDPQFGGKELWRTDGTVEGTQKFASGIDFIGRERAVAGDKLYFNSETEATGFELWVTDGTERGTHLVRDITPGSEGHGAANLHAAPDGTLLFRSDTPQAGAVLWRTDGTELGTVPIADLASQQGEGFPTIYWNVGDFALFRAWTAETGIELWSLDASTGDTTLLADTVAGPEHGGFQPIGNSASGLMFLSDGYLWSSDGTVSGTTRVTDFRFGSAGRGVPYDDWFAFSASLSGGDNLELWLTDGRPEGTFMIDVVPGSERSRPGGFIEIGNELYFHAQYGTGRELYVTDGTSPGTRVLPSSGASTEDSDVRTVAQLPNGKIIVQADDGVTGPGLFSVDQDGSFELLRDYPRNSFPAIQFALIGEHLYFDDLWVTDGTRAGTKLITDSFTLYDNVGFEVVGDSFFFQAQFEGSLWLVSSDGTEAGTRLVKNLGQLDSFEMQEFHGQLMFKASDETRGEELWITDGSPAGTRIVKDLTPGVLGSQIRDLTRLGGHLYFTATLENKDGQQHQMLVQSDGTAAGTIVLVDESVTELTNTHGLLFFNVASGNQTGLWRSDGTFGGTFSMAALRPDLPINIFSVFGLGNRAYFRGNEQYWVTDGTLQGSTVLPWLDDADLVFPWNSKLLVRKGDRLFESDGTEENSFEIDTTGLGVERLGYVTATGPGLYARIRGARTGQELYRITPRVESTPQVVGFNVEQKEDGGLQSVAIEFSEFVWPSLTVADLLIVERLGVSTSKAVDSREAIFAWDFESNTANWDISNLNLAYGVFDFEIGREGVFDVNNNVLDGNGDGLSGDTFRQQVTTAVPGDINLDGVVNFADFLLLSANFGSEGGDWLTGDLDGDRTVGFADFLILSRNFGVEHGN